MTSKPEASKAKKGVSRRTVVVGTAWAVPAIVVASAAPAMALSGPVTFTGRACKSPGNPKRYLFEISVTNSNNVPLQLNAISLVIDGVTSANVCPTTGTIAPNSTQTVVIAAGTYPDSAERHGHSQLLVRSGRRSLRHRFRIDVVQRPPADRRTRLPAQHSHWLFRLVAA